MKTNFLEIWYLLELGVDKKLFEARRAILLDLLRDDFMFYTWSLSNVYQHHFYIGVDKRVSSMISINFKYPVKCSYAIY